MFRNWPAMLLVLAVALLAFPHPAQGFFAKVGTTFDSLQGYPPDARSEALAGAYRAIAEGPAGQWWNPAALQEGHLIQAGYLWADRYFSFGDFDAVSASAEVGDFRFGVYRGEFRSPELVVRTALQPEGTGQTTRALDRLWLVGVSTDLAPLLFPRTEDLQWSCGLNYRRVSRTFALASAESATDDTIVDEADFDLGSLARMSWPAPWSSDPSDRLGLSAGLVLQNILDSEYVMDEVFRSRLGRWLHVGLALEGTLGQHAEFGHLLKCVVAYSGNVWAGSGGRADEFVNHWGLEITGLSLVSARAGWNEGVFDGASHWTYGMGLTLKRSSLPVGLRFDFARIDMGPHFGSWLNRFNVGLLTDF